MTEPQLTASVDELIVVSNFVSSVANDFSAELADVTQFVEDFLSSEWSESTAAAYDRAWVEWKSGGGEIVSALRDSASKLHDAAAAFSQRDTVIAQQLTSAQGLLNL